MNTEAKHHTYRFCGILLGALVVPLTVEEDYLGTAMLGRKDCRGLFWRLTTTQWIVFVQVVIGFGPANYRSTPPEPENILECLS